LPTYTSILSPASLIITWKEPKHLNPDNEAHGSRVMYTLEFSPDLQAPFHPIFQDKDALQVSP
jgi:hypothetical protein